MIVFFPVILILTFLLIFSIATCWMEYFLSNKSSQNSILCLKFMNRLHCIFSHTTQHNTQYNTHNAHTHTHKGKMKKNGSSVTYSSMRVTVYYQKKKCNICRSSKESSELWHLDHTCSKCVLESHVTVSQPCVL